MKLRKLLKRVKQGKVSPKKAERTINKMWTTAIQNSDGDYPLTSVGIRYLEDEVDVGDATRSAPPVAAPDPDFSTPNA